MVILCKIQKLSIYHRVAEWFYEYENVNHMLQTCLKPLHCNSPSLSSLKRQIVKCVSDELYFLQ